MDTEPLTHLLSIVCLYKVASKHDFHGLGLADVARKALGAAGAGDGANVDLGLPELGLLSRVDDVAKHG